MSTINLIDYVTAAKKRGKEITNVSTLKTILSMTWNQTNKGVRLHFHIYSSKEERETTKVHLQVQEFTLFLLYIF